MPNQTLTPNTAAPTSPAPTPQPSIRHRLEQTLRRDLGQIVQAHPVGGDDFRVNWIVMDGPSAKIVKSQFLRAVVGEDNKLTVEDKTVKHRPNDLLSQYL